MQKNVIILGAGGHAKVIADILIKNSYNVIGFLDDNVPIDNVVIHEKNLKVLGPISDCVKYNDVEFVIGIGDNFIREKIANLYDLKYCVVIANNAVIGSDVEIGEGSVVMNNVVINAGSKVGKHCIINTSAIIEHECILNNYIHISPNVALAGNVVVGNNVHIGIGASIKNNINIIDNVVVGAGAVVVKNIEEAGIYVGVPSRKMK